MAIFLSVCKVIFCDSYNDSIYYDYYIIRQNAPCDAAFAVLGDFCG